MTQVWEFSFRKQTAALGDRQSLELVSFSKNDTSASEPRTGRPMELAKDVPFTAPQNQRASMGKQV